MKDFKLMVYKHILDLLNDMVKDRTSMNVDLWYSIGSLIDLLVSRGDAEFEKFEQEFRTLTMYVKINE